MMINHHQDFESSNRWLPHPDLHLRLAGWDLNLEVLLTAGLVGQVRDRHLVRQRHYVAVGGHERHAGEVAVGPEHDEP